MSIYLVICLIVALGGALIAAKSKQLGWFIAGATALALLLGIPEISAPFIEIAQGFAGVIARAVGDHNPIGG